MEIFKIIGIGLTAAVAVLIVKPLKPEIALLISIAGGAIIFIMVVNMLGSVVSSFSEIFSGSGISLELFSILLKIIGIGYLTEFASNICYDSQNASLADKIQLGGKVTILLIAMPIFKSIFEIIAGLL